MNTVGEFETSMFWYQHRDLLIDMSSDSNWIIFASLQHFENVLIKMKGTSTDDEDYYGPSWQPYDKAEQKWKDRRFNKTEQIIVRFIAQSCDLVLGKMDLFI